jgi:hypothetical protein
VARAAPDAAVPEQAARGPSSQPPRPLGAAQVAAATEALIGAEPATESQVGGEYRTATVSPLPATGDPFSVDPAVVERGLRGHADTQNALAAAIAAAGLTARSSRASEPNFDLAWEANGTVFVAEVKSITPGNEERQLRLGVGQVLRYRNLLGQRGLRVRAVLVPERAPRDPSWSSLCEELGVLLVTPPYFEPLFE